MGVYFVRGWTSIGMQAQLRVREFKGRETSNCSLSFSVGLVYVSLRLCPMQLR